MSMNSQSIARILAVTAIALGLAACGPNDNQTAGQKLDNAIERTEQAADNVKAQANRAAETAGQKLDNAVEATKDAAANAADATQDAAAQALNAAGEAGITAKVNAALMADAELSALNINVDTHGSVVTLKGDAPSQSAKDRAQELAKAVDGVTSVANLLTVK